MLTFEKLLILITNASLSIVENVLFQLEQQIKWLLFGRIQQY
jgi:hypothetical protein